MRSQGVLVLFGSGESSPSGQKIHRNVFSTLPFSQNIAILETPAGFQPNSSFVANEIARVFQILLSEFVNSVTVIPARKKGTEESPDNAELLRDLDNASYIFLGPGSPTYAAAQLACSKALRKIGERWQDGATIALSSAAAIAFGRYVLPVYEIYKAGEELHWEEGLNFFESIGLSLTIVTHWNNKEGGKDLDTRFCYMGKDRFDTLLELLPKGTIVLGIDEHTAVIVDPKQDYFFVEGKGTATLFINGKQTVFSPKETYAIQSLKDGKIRTVARKRITPLHVKKKQHDKRPVGVTDLPKELSLLFQKRKVAKKRRDFTTSDSIRKTFEKQGYSIEDTKNGQEVYNK